MTARDINQEPNEFKNFVLFYTSSTQAMVDSQFENLWDTNSGSGLGCHPTEDYGAETYVPRNQAIIYQQSLSS